MAATANSDIQNWKRETESLLENISSSADKFENSLEKIKSGFDSVQADGSNLIAQLEHLKSSAENAKNSLQKVLSQIDGNDNSTALILQKNGEVSKQLDRISQDAESLISDVKKNGIKLNVDIF